MWMASLYAGINAQVLMLPLFALRFPAGSGKNEFETARSQFVDHAGQRLQHGSRSVGTVVVQQDNVTTVRIVHDALRQPLCIPDVRIAAAQSP